jgi:hypothetical protein
MANVKVKLLRPLNGEEIGSEKTYEKSDAERLAGYGAVEILGDTKQPTEQEAAALDAKAEKPLQNKADAVTEDKVDVIKTVKGKK